MVECVDVDVACDPSLNDWLNVCMHFRVPWYACGMRTAACVHAVCIAWNARSHFCAKALNHCKSCPIGGQFDAGWIAHGVKEDDDT